MLHTPRITFAMGEHGDFPALFAKIPSRFRTPHVSIVIFAVILLTFSIASNFRWNAMLSSVARPFVYGSVAAALPALRTKQPHADRFRLPFGISIAAIALLFCLLLVTRMHRGEFIVISITAAFAFMNWLWTRKGGNSLINGPLRDYWIRRRNVPISVILSCVLRLAVPQRRSER